MGNLGYLVEQAVNQMRIQSRAPDLIKVIPPDRTGYTWGRVDRNGRENPADTLDFCFIRGIHTPYYYYRSYS